MDLYKPENEATMPKRTTSGLQVVEAETKTGKWPVMICGAHSNLSAHCAHPRSVLACKDGLASQGGGSIFGFNRFQVHGFVKVHQSVTKFISLCFKLSHGGTMVCSGMGENAVYTQ